MKIAICDDEALFRNHIPELISEYAAQKKHPFCSTSVFERGTDLLNAARESGGFDLYILDIIMPQMDGIELGLRLRNAGFDGKVVYLTSSQEYAIDSYKVRALDYIIKPVEKDKLFAILDEVYACLSSRKPKYLVVKTRDGSTRIDIAQLLYAQLNKRTVLYHMADGRTVESLSIRAPFSETVQDLLRDGRFVLCGAGMAANLDHVTAVESTALVFDGRYRTLLGIKACRELRSVWYDYLFDKEGHR